MLEDRGTSQAPVVNLDLAVPCDALCDIWAVVWPPAARGKAWLMMRRHDRLFFRPTVVKPHMGMVKHCLTEHPNWWSEDALYVASCWPEGGMWYRCPLPEEIRI